MTKRKKVLLWRGLTSVTASLLVVAIFGTQCANTYEGSINSFLGTSTSRIVDSEDSGTEDTIYYESAYGEYSAENLQLLIEDTYEEAVLEQEEGSVLLKNEGNALPLDTGSRMTLFGHAWVQPVYAPGGANSSGTEEYIISPYDALVDAGFAINDTLYQAYQESDTTRVASNNLMMSGRAEEYGTFYDAPDLGEESIDFYTDDLKESWSEDYNDVALVMLAREGGEDKEMMMEDPEGISALALHQDEKDLLEMIQDSNKFEKVIVLLNSAFPMEVEWLDEYGVDACLWIGNPGQRGFEGVANLLTGEANPSGRLVDTYAVDSLSSPAAHTSSQNTTIWTNIDEVMDSGIVTDQEFHVEHVTIQAEGIYIGYKYYETRYEDSILNPDSGASSSIGASNDAESWVYQDEVSYPFGYGLSYTTFEQKLDRVTYDESEDLFTAVVTVTNTGSVSGKSVAQLYVQTPYGDYEKENLVEKSSVQLIGFGKTGELQPGESETLTITIDQYLMASYDYVGAEGYILSAGDYYLALGDDAHDALNNILAAKGASGMVDQDGNEVDGDASKTYSWHYDSIDTESYRYSDTGEEVTNQFEDCDINYWQEGTVTYLTRSDWDGTFPEEAIEVACTEEMMYILQGETYEKAEDALSVDDFEQGVNNGLTLVEMKDVDYDDEETWNAYLDQMTIEELATQISDSSGIVEMVSVGKPDNAIGDGTASIGGSTFPEEYGDTRSACLYPSTVTVASSWSLERLEQRGFLMAEEALYCGLPVVWNGGCNLHRTPFGGRNGEYYSEDSILTYLQSAAQMEVMQEKGVAAGVKHCVGNDQELYRESLVTFFNEQAFREGSLKGFEGVLQKAGSLATMQAFNRLGLTWSSSNEALCTQVLRNEWGFKGVEETDAVVGLAYKTHFSTSLSAGTTTYCMDFGNLSTTAIVQEILANDDGDLLEDLRNAVKSYHYMLSRSNAINGLSANSTIEEVMPWWQIALYALDAVLVLMTLGCLIMLIRSKTRMKTNDVVIDVPEDRKG